MAAGRRRQGGQVQQGAGRAAGPGEGEQRRKRANRLTPASASSLAAHGVCVCVGHAACAGSRSVTPPNLALAPLPSSPQLKTSADASEATQRLEQLARERHVPLPQDFLLHNRMVEGAYGKEGGGKSGGGGKRHGWAFDKVGAGALGSSGGLAGAWSHKGQRGARVRSEVEVRVFVAFPLFRLAADESLLPLPLHSCMQPACRHQGR